MNLAHDDMIECIERNRVVIETKLVSHDDIARQTAEFLSRGGRIDRPEPVQLRCVKVTREDGRGGENVRWENDTRPFTKRGEGLTGWRNANKMILPGTPEPRLVTVKSDGEPTRKRCTARTQAQAKGEQFYTTDEPCNRGHVGQRYTSSGTCRECQISLMRTKRMRAAARAEIRAA